MLCLKRKEGSRAGASLCLAIGLGAGLFFGNLDQSQARSRSRWAPRTSFEWVNGIHWKDVRDSAINPDNRVLELETVALKSDFRADLQLRYLSSGKIVLRPRLLVSGSELHYGDTEFITQRTKSSPDLTEGFLDWNFGNLTLVSGLQNYQWGPAELVSPSNSIFHFNSSQKSFLFKGKGKTINRVNYSIGEALSAVVLQEALDNQELFWIADRSFEKKSLIKIEGRSQSNANRYLGLVYGEVEDQRKFAGLYFNYNFSDAFSVYFDGRHSESPFIYVPKEVTPQLVVMQELERDPDSPQQYAIVGFRWQSVWDFRFEYLYNSKGYSKGDLGSAIQSTQAPNPYALSNLNRLLRSGLEILGRQYAYLSLRIPDLGKKRDANIFFRYLHSLQDESMVAQLDYDKAVNDMMNFYFEGTVNGGSKDTEFNLLEKGSLFAGFRLSW